MGTSNVIFWLKFQKSKAFANPLRALSIGNDASLPVSPVCAELCEPF
jgi:hypothetical protein